MKKIYIEEQYKKEYKMNNKKKENESNTSDEIIKMIAQTLEIDPKDIKEIF